MSKVLVPLADGFEEIEAVSIIDILRRGDVEVLVASLNEKRVAKGAHNITIETDVFVKDVSSEELDMIVLPGGWNCTLALAEDANVQRLLQEMDAKGKHIAAICASPFALDKAGVLKEKYTCFPSVEKEIENKGYQGEASMIVEDANIITSRGPATALCFALALVKKLKGEEVYKDVQSALLATHCEEQI